MRAILLMTFAACSLNVDYTGTNFACDNGVCPEGFVCLQNLCIPTEPAPPTCTASIATGDNHSCLVRDTDGSVWCWGRNHQGQLGNDTTADSTVPVQVEGITGASTVLTGGNYSCAIVDGAVSCWGANDEGQLGDNSQVSSRTPVGNGLIAITAMALGSQHACAINTDGAVFCWGANADGQLGDDTTSSRRVPGVVAGVSATAISASDDSTCVVDSKVLKCWGQNGEGLFMNGTTDSVGVPTPSTLLMNVAGVSIGGAHLCVFTDSGEVHCAGGAVSGQLGNGVGGTGAPNSSLPVRAFIPSKVVALSAGNSHTCAVDEAGAAWCWGDDEGKLGLETSLDFAAFPVKASFTDVAAIAAGGDHTCARSTSGAISCAGSNTFGQLGNTDRTTQSVPQPVPGLTGVASLATGGDFTCALSTSGTATCWGDGGEGELGDGAFHQRAVPGPAILTGIDTLVAGGDHACAITTDGGVSCWGRGTSGQLGDGATVSRGTPLPVPGLSGVTQLALGNSHSCALVSGEVRCWGSNNSGQLGVTTDNPEPLPVVVAGLVDPPIKQIAAGANHTCVLDNANEVQCFGAGTVGQLGNNLAVNNSTPVKVVLKGATMTNLGMVDELFARGDDTFARIGGTVFGWGYGCDSRIGSPDAVCSDTVAAVQVADVSTAARLAIGYSSACVLKADNALACWGANYFGQIGDGTYNTTRPVPIPSLSGVVDVSVGGEHACAVQSDATVVCWGGAHAGQLGDGVLADSKPNFVRALSCE